MPALGMTSLTSRQRAHLRKLAHHLKPVVHIGGEGVSNSVLASITEALNTRELLKAKLQESASIDVKSAAATIVEQLDGVHSVQIIGRTIVLYRAHPEEPEIRLPAPKG